VGHGVLDDSGDLVHGAHINLAECVLTGGLDLRLNSLDESDTEDDGEQTLEEALVLPGLLPDLEIGVKLEGSLVGLRCR